MPGRAPAGRIVVLGIIGQIPFAGVAWQVAPLPRGAPPAGLRVFYVEDTGDWPYDAERNDDHRRPALHDRVHRAHAWRGRAGRAVGVPRRSQGTVFGPAAVRLRRAVPDADALVNVTGAHRPRDEHLRVPVRIYLETDPVLPQIEVARRTISRTIDLLAAHTHHFTFGENLGAAGLRRAARPRSVPADPAAGRARLVESPGRRRPASPRIARLHDGLELAADRQERRVGGANATAGARTTSSCSSWTSRSDRARPSSWLCRADADAIGLLGRTAGRARRPRALATSSPTGTTSAALGESSPSPRIRTSGCAAGGSATAAPATSPPAAP